MSRDPLSPTDSRASPLAPVLRRLGGIGRAVRKVCAGTGHQQVGMSVQALAPAGLWPLARYALRAPVRRVCEGWANWALTDPARHPSFAVYVPALTLVPLGAVITNW